MGDLVDHLSYMSTRISRYSGLTSPSLQKDPKPPGNQSFQVLKAPIMNSVLSEYGVSNT